MFATKRLSLSSRFNRLSFSDLSRKPKVGGIDKSFTLRVREKPKKKIAMVCGFIGSKYSGMQFSQNEKVATIERELAIALHRVGCISDDNHMSLDKVGWSRSSRTDKGVHSNRLVVSMKALLEPAWLVEGQDQVLNVVSLLNDVLPPDIRVFSCVRVNGGFSAKTACNWREYEYLLPVDMLLMRDPKCFSQLSTHPTGAASEAEIHDKCVQLNSFLKELEGSHSFHNFCRTKKLSLMDGPGGYSAKAHRRRYSDRANDNASDSQLGKGGIRNEVDRVEDHTEEVGGLDCSQSSVTDAGMVDTAKDDIGESVKLTTAAGKFGERLSNYNIFDRWEVGKPIERSQRYRGNMYHVGTVLDASTPSQTPQIIALEHDTVSKYVRIRIRGQSFLLNQIRLMIGTALLASNDVLPRYVIELALKSYQHIPLPLVPAEGLILLDAGFNRNKGGKSYTTEPHECFNKADEKANDINAHAALMSKEEYEVSELFREQQLYPTVGAKWTNELISHWMSVALESFKLRISDSDDVSNDIHPVDSTWRGLLEDIRSEESRVGSIKSAMHLERVRGHIHDFDKMNDKMIDRNKNKQRGKKAKHQRKDKGIARDTAVPASVIRRSPDGHVSKDFQELISSISNVSKKTPNVATMPAVTQPSVSLNSHNPDFVDQPPVQMQSRRDSQITEEDWSSSTSTRPKKQKKQPLVVPVAARSDPEVVLKHAQQPSARSTKKTEMKKNGIPHGYFLPNGMCTALTAHYNLIPGSLIVLEALRALATMVASKQCPVDWSCQQFLQHMDDTGGLAAWSIKHKHRNIL